MNPIDQLKQTYEQNALKASEDAKHFELVDSNAQTQEVILRSFSSLVDFLSSHVTRTEVLNQLEQIGTPDAYVVADAVNKLHESFVAKPDLDLSQLTTVLTEILDQARQIPKEQIELPEPEKQIDYSERFTSLESAVNAITEAVKEQETTVEAPVVNVPETKVNVDAPDLTPLTKDLKAVEKAVKSLVFPEYKTDNKEVEKLLKKTNKTLAEILYKPVGGGGGGGGRVSPYETSAGIPSFVELAADGSIPVSVTDPNKEDAIPYAEVLTASTSITPTSGKRLQLLKSQVLQNPDNATANLVTLAFVSTGDLVTGWAFSDSNEWVGATDEALSITLGNTNPVSVNIRYKEIT